jgi:hypothetical protein
MAAPGRINRSQKSDIQSWEIGKDQEGFGEGSGREEKNRRGEVRLICRRQSRGTDRRAQALVMAEYEEAFERPQYGFQGGRGSGFVKAGGRSKAEVGN